MNIFLKKIEGQVIQVAYDGQSNPAYVIPAQQNPTVDMNKGYPGPPQQYGYSDPSFNSPSYPSTQQDTPNIRPI